MKSRQIICFTDWDGVLHRYRAHANEYFECLPALEEVLRSFPEVLIVVSSDWRKLHTLDELRVPFSADIRSRLVGMSPCFSFEQYGEGIRFEEAQSYLREHNLDLDRFVAIDDIAENWVNTGTKEIDHRLAVCEDGFYDREAALLTQALLLLTEG